MSQYPEGRAEARAGVALHADGSAGGGSSEGSRKHSRDRDSASEGPQAKRGRRKHPDLDLLVNNIPSSTPVNKIVEHFSRYGEVKSVRTHLTISTNLMKALIRFREPGAKERVAAHQRANQAQRANENEVRACTKQRTNEAQRADENEVEERLAAHQRTGEAQRAIENEVLAGTKQQAKPTRDGTPPREEEGGAGGAPQQALTPVEFPQEDTAAAEPQESRGSLRKGESKYCTPPTDNGSASGRLLRSNSVDQRNDVSKTLCELAVGAVVAV